MDRYDTLSGLEKAAARIKQLSLSEMFKADANRVDRFSHRTGGLLVDFSKQKLDGEALNVLLDFAKERGVADFLQKMNAGEAVNPTEGRAAQHMALRAEPGQESFALGQNISNQIAASLTRMESLCDEIRTGKFTGASGQTITDIVHIGIGGSHLGPELVIQALQPSAQLGVDVHFVANIDPAEISDVLEGLDPARSLVLVVSKSFSTVEALANARVARDWLRAGVGETAVARQMFAVSAQVDRAVEFGIDPTHIFEFADWVGGRFSLWSAVGLSIMAGLGVRVWGELLAGARAMDAHVLQTPLAQNLPVLSALISFWNLNFLQMPGRAVIPYSARMALLPNWMQQLVMESNGKGVQSNGAPVQFSAAPILFGDVGTNAQHAFFQALHQGPNVVPVDFIGIIRDAENNPEQHRILLANMLAQSSALMVGQTDRKNPHKHFTGDRPSTSILLDELSPVHLGSLLAFYEHETVILGQLCSINPFDQWGVELGKVLAVKMEQRLAGGAPTGQDASSENLLQEINKRPNDGAE